MTDKPHLSFEIQPKPKGRKTEIWTVVDQKEYRLGAVSWWAPWRRYTFHPDGSTVYDADCLREISGFCREETLKRKLAVAVAKGYPPCFSYCKREVPHDGECVPMEGR
jgi:hypothetical protein